MKLSAALLVGSVGLNAACLAALVLNPTLVPPALRQFFAGDTTPHAAAPAAATPAMVSSDRPAPVKLWPALDAGGDLPKLIARLRSAGFPPDIVRAMALAELSARYDARLRAFYEPDPATPFWKVAPNFFGPGDRRMEEYGQLQRERARLQRELLADPFFATDDITAEQRRQFGPLSRQKIEQVQRIEDDYADMNSAIRSGTAGILLAEDREKLALLARERRADLAAVLTPEELAEYDVRSSPITRMLARQMAGFEPSEAEFRAIFAAQSAYSDRLGPLAQSGIGNLEVRQAATRELNEQLKTALGPARYAAYVRETDSTYQQLVRLVQRENMPSDTAVRAFDIRESVAAESSRIADDPSLDVDQKKAALQALAERTRTQLLGILGPNAGPSYIKVLDARWLNMVQRGNAVSFGASSGSGIIGMSGPSSMPVSISFGLSPSFRNVAQPLPRP